MLGRELLFNSKKNLLQLVAHGRLHTVVDDGHRICFFAFELLSERNEQLSNLVGSLHVVEERETGFSH
jgi:hypothetical protein